jgi:hypothetical protein
MEKLKNQYLDSYRINILVYPMEYHPYNLYNLDRDCFSRLIYWIQNEDIIPFGLTSQHILTIFRDYYKKLPITECLIMHQFCSCVPTFEFNFPLLHDIIYFNKNISFKWILNTYNIPLNELLNAMYVYTDDIIVLTLMEFCATKLIPRHINIDHFLALYKRIFNMDRPLLFKFTFENPNHHNMMRQTINNLCEYNSHLDQSRIQIYLDYYGHNRKKNYKLLYALFLHNHKCAHLVYTFIYPEIDMLTHEILDHRCNDYQSILANLPHDYVYRTEIYNNFINILDIEHNIVKLLHVMMATYENKIQIKNEDKIRKILRHNIIERIRDCKNDIPFIILAHHILDLGFTQKKFDLIMDVYILETDTSTIKFLSLLTKMNLNKHINLPKILSQMFRHQIHKNRTKYTCEDDLNLVTNYALQNNIILDQKMLREELNYQHKGQPHFNKFIKSYIYRYTLRANIKL